MSPSKFNRPDGLKIFFINLSDVDVRLDPLYYFSVNNLSIVNNTRYPVKKLFEVIEMQRGRFGHRPRNEPRFYGGEYPFIQTGDIVRASQTNGQITYSQTLNELGLQTSRLFSKPVVVVTIAANIGDAAILDYPACFPDSLIGMTPKTNELTLDYINLYFKFIKDYLEDLAPQSAQKNINYQQLSPVPIVTPSLEIQHHAVQIYQTALIQRQQKEQQAQALLAGIDTYLMAELGIILPYQDNNLNQRIFKVRFCEVSGTRFDPFFNNIYYSSIEKEIENGFFAHTKLKQLCFSCGGVVYSRHDEAESGKAILRANNISLGTNELNFESIRYLCSDFEIDKKQKLHAGDILMCSASGSKEHVGKVAYIEKELDFYFGGFMMVLRQKTIDYNHRFLFEYLQCNFFRKLLFRVLGGTNINNLNFGMLANFPVPLPPIEKQKEIVNHIMDIRAKAKILQTEAAQILADAKFEVERLILGE